MIRIRKAAERGETGTYWLDSRHSFSFADYHDPAQMGFGPLRVINEDWVAPGAGFGMHPHRDMEILTYVLEGAVEHQDSAGHRGVIRPGELQYMAAGTGILHSEQNASKDEPVHLLQIWIQPERAGFPPAYDQADFNGSLNGRLRLVASGDGREGSLAIHRDIGLYATRLGAGETVEHAPASGRKVWVQVARGAAELNGAALEAGDGAAIEDEGRIVLKAGPDGAEALLFDMQ
jgi:hypothetical protein